MQLGRFLSPLVVALALGACDTVPITGRSQINFVDEQTEAQLGAQAFAQIKSELPVSRDAQATARVREIAQRIIRANDLGTKWDVVVIEQPQINAFALPGGHVAVYRGMLQFVENDAQLAAVIGHEIGHVLARHAAERISTSQLLEAGAGAASVALGATTGVNPQTMGALLGAGATYGIQLPFSRRHEYEADRIGAVLMAKAGYDPRAAVALWRRMAARGGARTPEFLSTHPASDNRVEALQEIMPEALKAYRAGPDS